MLLYEPHQVLGAVVCILVYVNTGKCLVAFQRPSSQIPTSCRCLQLSLSFHHLRVPPLCSLTRAFPPRYIQGTLSSILHPIPGASTRELPGKRICVPNREHSAFGPGSPKHSLGLGGSVSGMKYQNCHDCIYVWKGNPSSEQDSVYY